MIKRTTVCCFLGDPLSTGLTGRLKSFSISMSDFGNAEVCNGGGCPPRPKAPILQSGILEDTLAPTELVGSLDVEPLLRLNDRTRLLRMSMSRV